jgi:hypothetical protein
MTHETGRLGAGSVGEDLQHNDGGENPGAKGITRFGGWVKDAAKLACLEGRQIIGRCAD